MADGFGVRASLSPVGADANRQHQASRDKGYKWDAFPH